MSNEPKKPVCDPAYWQYRLHWAAALGRGTYVAIYDIDPNTWQNIQNVSKQILGLHVKSGESLLDVGCGYGALSAYLPDGIIYQGVDVSPDMVAVARLAYPHQPFEVGDAQVGLRFADGQFDWAVCRSIRRMIIDNLGQPVWDQMEVNILRVAKQLILIEYEDLWSYRIFPRDKEQTE